MNSSSRIFLTRAELAREVGLAESQLRRLLQARGIVPTATAAYGRLQLFSPAIREKLTPTTPKKNAQ
jgi:hypothetical protein